MSFKASVFRLLRNGRTLLRHFWTNPASKDVVDSRIVNSASTVRIVQEHARRLFIDNVLKRVSNSTAAELRRRTAKRLLFGNSAPFLAFVGVSLASGSGIITEEDELEAACWGIRETISALSWTFIKEESELFISPSQLTGSLRLEDFSFGKLVAKGCNGVVYTAKLKTDASGNDNQTQDESNESSFPLAVKMMFNYDAESNAMSILRAMYRETVPAMSYSMNEDILNWEANVRQRCRTLPPHPNIVRVYNAFTDCVQALPGSQSLYPDALPTRINPNGFGRNMSLFLLMKRYNMSLKEYLSNNHPNPKVGVLLLTQLLEAVAHMVSHGVAHRDLKADNILVDLNEGDDASPTVAVADFGCCLADQMYGLILPYSSPDTDKGGNAALMAPEVACAVPGPFTHINYSKADVWAVGTLAYEIFGMDNPFHRIGSEQKQCGKSMQFLMNLSYSELDLPALPDSVPPVISKLIGGMLTRSPSKRVSAELAATVCQLYLWAPSAWTHQGNDKKLPSSSEILQWLLCLTTKVLCEGRRISSAKFESKNRDADSSGVSVLHSNFKRPSSEYLLIESFLHRIKLSVVHDALQWINQS